MYCGYITKQIYYVSRLAHLEGYIKILIDLLIKIVT